jgi:hypothetical protein
MNFIELRVEEYIDEVLDSDSPDHAASIQALRKFVLYLDRETEIYSVQDITEPDALDFLRTIRNIRERDITIAALNGFFGFLHAKTHVDRPLRLEAQRVFRPKPSEKVPDVADFLDGDEDEHRFKPRRLQE